MEDVQQLVFPRTFSSADARAWASLYGFEHLHVARDRGRVMLVQRPESDFVRSSVDVGFLRDGVLVVDGDLTAEAHARTLDAETEYDRRARRLRRYAFRDLPESAQPNDDLVAWYRRWLARTHRAMTADERAVARAIARRLRWLDRRHALAYVRKLESA